MIAGGTKLDHYEIIGQLGEGGMGEVYRARDTKLGRDVAIKVLPAAFSEDSERLRRFEQEAQAAGALNHPNILVIHHIGTHQGAPYIVSELLEGETLRERMAGAALPQRKALDYALQVAHGLAAAHEKGIVHRDLKPDNLFITKDDRVKILDFGLAKLVEPIGEGVAQTDIATRKQHLIPVRSWELSATCRPSRCGAVMWIIALISFRLARWFTKCYQDSVPFMAIPRSRRSMRS